MPDRALQEALRRLAGEAATRFSGLVAIGEEIPFDVAGNSGEGSFYRYVPLTSRFVLDHEQELRSLPAFEPACDLVSAAAVAAPYLEAQGMAVPEDESERAAEMLIAFVCNLWEGSAEFVLDRGRLEGALRQLEAESRDVSEAALLVAPLVGLQMPLKRLDLPSGVRIARADTVNVPPEAMRSEGMERSAWQPQLVAMAEIEGGREGSASAMRMLRELVSVLRLFKEGGVGLGPYVFAPTGEDRWRRIATGVPATRPGGYKLSEAEASELAEFARRLEARPDPGRALVWAIRRFEMGCDRTTALDGLSDHLLALRALFEQEGPIGAALPMRVAALISEPNERNEARAKVQSAFELERALMAGRRVDTGNAIGLAAWLEDAARAILREAALGALGTEVGGAADEALIAAGLEAGEGSPEQMGSTAEWDAVPDPSEAEGAEEVEILVSHVGGRGEPEGEPLDVALPDPDRIRIHAGGEIAVVEENGDEPWDQAEPEYDDSDAADEPDSDNEEGAVRQSSERDWLSEVSRTERQDTLEWPARKPLPGGDEHVDSPRVRHLFPVPEGTDWDVGELDYDRARTRSS